MGEQATVEPAAPARSLNRWAAAVIGLALIPVIRVFYGVWYSNALYENGDIPRGIFYIGTSLCLAGIYAIIVFILKPAANGLLIPLCTCPAGPPLHRTRAILSGLIILVSITWAGWITFTSRDLPGVELLLCLIAHWCGWLMRRPWETGIAARLWGILRGWLLAYLLFLGAGIVSLFWIYTHAQFQPWFLFPVVGAGVWLWLRRKEVPTIAWLVLLALAVYSYRIDHWLYAAVGDEYIFFHYANHITTMPPDVLNHNLFNCCFVYGKHPFLSSLIPGAWMKIFGANSFGWRFAWSLLSALSLPLLFSFFKTFVERRAALTATALLACSAYLMNFLKIGYDNPGAFFGQALLLAATAWAIREESPASYVGLALAGGLCFYLYPAALYILGPALLMLLLYRPPITWRRLFLWGLAGSVLAALLSPLLLQPQVVSARVMGTYFFTHDLNGSLVELIQHIGNNFVMSFFSGFHNPSESHYIASGYLDPFSAGFCLVGLALAAFWSRSERFPRCMWLSFLLMLFLTGVSHDRSTPPTTRMFMLLPWFAFFTALGIEWLITHFKAGALLRYTLLGVILLTNFSQAYHLALARRTSFQLLPSLSLKLAADLERVFPGQQRVYLFLSDTQWDPFGLRDIQSAYPQFLGNTQIEDLDINETILQQLVTRTKLPETYVIVHESVDVRWNNRIEPFLLAAGKKSCVQRTTAGEPRFTLWYTPDAHFPMGPCYPAVFVLPDWLFWTVALMLTVILDAAWVLWLRKRKKSGASAPPGNVLKPPPDGRSPRK